MLRGSALFLQYIERWTAARHGSLTDRELLRRFARQGDEDAFTLLVQRHGPMVLRVGRRVLANRHDAEEVFQAAFLILARKAGSVRWRDSVANWLYGVAFNLARQARTRNLRREARDGRPGRSTRSCGNASSPSTTPSRPPDLLEDMSARELLAALDDELSRLPARWREPLVLCYLEGATRDEAARRLGLAPGTLRSRVERAKVELGKRLSQRGLTLATAGLAALLGEEVAPAAVPAALASATVGMAAGGGPAVASSVLALTESGLQALAAGQVKTVTAWLAVIVLAVGASAAACFVGVSEPPQAKPNAEKVVSAPAVAEPAPKTDLYGDPLPAGAIARLGTMSLRHPDSGNPASSFSPDGKLLATGGGTGTVKVWKTATGRFLWQTPRNELCYHYPAFTPNGRWLVVSDGLSIRLLEPATGRESKRFPPESEQPSEPAEVWSLVCSPDGRLLAFAGREKQRNFIHVSNLEAGRQLHRLDGPSKGVAGAAFTRDGRMLITIGWDNQIIRWDVASGKAQKTVELTLPRLRNIRLSDDGETLVVAPATEEPVQLLDTETGKVRVKLEGEVPGRLNALAFSKDGKTLATNSYDESASQGWICLWETESGKHVRRFPVSPYAGSDLRFAPDGRTLLVGAQLWNYVTGERLHKRPAHETDVRSLAFAPDGRKLVSASGDEIRVWDVSTSRPLSAWRGHERGTHSLAILPDGVTAITAGWDGSLRLWDLATGQVRRQILVYDPLRGPVPPDFQVHNFHLAADGRTALSFSRAGVNPWLLQLWELNTGKELHRRTSSFDCFTVNCSVDLKLAVGYVSQHGELALLPPGNAVVVEVATGRQVLAVHQPGYASCLLFSPDGHTFVTTTSQFTRKPGGGDVEHYHMFHVWDLYTGRERLTITPTETAGHEHAINRLAITPDGRTLVAARNDYTILLWDLATGKELMRCGPADSWATCLAFSPDQNYLATSHVDSTILLWDISAATKRHSSPRQATAQELESWWADLAGEDARKAHTAIWSLAAVPEQATGLLRGRLQPAGAAPADKLKQWLRDLDAEQFERRETASKELAQWEELAELALEKALKDNPPQETRRRIESLLNAPRIVRSPDKLRQLRAIEVLEQCGTKEGNEVLAKLAEGAPQSRVTQEAKAALDRLSRR